MIVVHFESGLGNQMLNYAEYLAVKLTHADEDIYMENVIYEIGKDQDKINMWNGYELKRIFNIDIPNISDLFSENEWKDIISEIKSTNFWNNNWDYSNAICAVLRNHGISLTNYSARKKNQTLKQKAISWITNTRVGYFYKRQYARLFPLKMIKKKSHPDELFLQDKKDIYTGQKLLFMYKGNEIQKIEKQLINDFSFPKFPKGSRGEQVLKDIENSQSVGIHVRRSDMLYANGYLYRYGYFKRAVKLARKKINNPVFYIFGDTNSTDWIKENPTRIGLHVNDKINYIDFNKGNDSFRDMQLMSSCICNIISNSSFGWWSSFLNQRENKVTISPFSNYNTTDWT